MNELPPYPMTEEEYELLCEAMGSAPVDEAIEEYKEKKENDYYSKVSGQRVG